MSPVEDHFRTRLTHTIEVAQIARTIARALKLNEDLTEAIDITPSLPDGYFFRAELYFAQRKHAQAIKDYEVAIPRSAQFYEAYLSLGRAREWVLDYERARQQAEGSPRANDTEAKAVARRAGAAPGRTG